MPDACRHDDLLPEFVSRRSVPASPRRGYVIRPFLVCVRIRKRSPDTAPALRVRHVLDSANVPLYLTHQLNNRSVK